MSEPNPAQRLVEIIAELQLAEPTPELLSELQAILEDAKARRLYIELTHLQDQLETLHTRRAAEHLDQQADMDEIFALLQQAEDAAPEVIVHLPSAKPSKRRSKKHADQPELTLLQTMSAASYLLKHSLTPKVVGSLAAAAAVLLGVLLAVVLLTGPDEGEPVAGTPDPTPPTVDTPRIAKTVATLTASHDAQWDSQPAEDLRRGSKLHPNQRLTLTAGFAEITTNHGAIAILEAPATIELLDNNNAIRLHTGKLVGICETDSSKGFVVRTPHMNVTDLGTRFGVDASTTDATEVHVFEGEVQAERVDAAVGTEPTLLVANQSARTSADTDVITRIDHDADRFAALLPTTTQLPGTGHGLAVGDTDPKWQIVAIDGRPLESPQDLRVSGSYGEQDFELAGSSQWLSWDPPQKPEPNRPITYTFRTRLDLPGSVDLASARLRMQYAADNQALAIRVNGQRFELDHAPAFGKWKVHTRVLQGALRHGENTIEFDVAAHWHENATRHNLVGLNARWGLVNDPAFNN